MKLTKTGFLSALASAFLSTNALACDMTQLATHMNWCWRVKSHQASPANSGIIRNLIDAVKYGNNSMAWTTYAGCASAVNKDAEKHQIACQKEPDAFLRAARHVVSCYEPNPSSKFVDYGNASASGGQEAGIKLCVRP